MTREEHLQWANDRACEYADMGDKDQAYASFRSDMSKHEETRDHIALQIMDQMYFGGMFPTPSSLSKFIKDFN